MADSKQLAVLKKGVTAWNTWRRQTGLSLRHPSLKEQGEAKSFEDIAGQAKRLEEVAHHILKSLPNLLFNKRAVDLKRANLTNAKLWEVDFADADLREAQLSGARLHEADLRGADLSRANLSSTDLSRAQAENAQFNGANLSHASARRANLKQADLTGANLSRGDFSDANLAGARLCSSDLHEAILIRANLSGADLSSANLNGATMINTVLEGATLSGARVYGLSAWDIELNNAKQDNLIITPPGEPEITVDNLEVAQFIYLLLNNDRIRDVIDTITSKAVLILGRFTPERKATLDALRNALRSHNYLPILFDFQRPATRDFTETVSTLAHLSRFIVADLTDPRSIPQELTAVIPRLLSVPVRPLLRGSQTEWAMFSDLARYPQVISPFHYNDDDVLLDRIESEVIAPAEQMAREFAGR